jgi:hypothetical protein
MSTSRRLGVVAVVVALAVGAAGAAPIIVTTTQTEVTIGGLTCGTRYRVRVNVAGSSPVTTMNPVTKPCTAPQSPPPPGVLFDQLSDFPVFFNIHGASEISTPYGPGLRVVARAGVDVAPWDSGSKVVMGKWFYPSDFLGKTYDWQFHYMFPASGNAQGFPQTWHAGANFEVGHTGASGHHIAVNTSQNPAGQIAIGIHLPPFGNNYAFTWLANPIQLDHWYKVRFQIKWSTGSDGFINIWIDDVLRASRIGATVTSGVIPAMQVGYYSANVLTNEVRYGGVQYRRTG